MRDSEDERPTDAHGVVDGSSGDDDGVNEDGVTVTTVSNDHLRNGTDVGGYIVDGELGSGGMGVVYSATHPVIGKRAAIKVLKPELSRNPPAVERFMMEARAVNQIGHPNIVDIFAFGTLADGRSYYVMDLLTGEPLRRRVKRGGPLHPAEAISIIDETASALMAAHDKGIVHRDLKPDNIFMVSAPGRWPEVRILDWGLLKLTSQQSAIANSRYRTLAGSVMGTPVYMSPEQARASDAVDFRTDVYSLGVMSYELLAGVVPFKKGSSIDTLLAHQDEPVPPLADKCPGLPIELVQLIEAMLAKEPEGRPTLAAVRAVIKRLRGTKIPTMTAAGLQMPEPAPPTPRLFGELASDPSTRPATPFFDPPTAPALSSGGAGPYVEPPNMRLSGETTVPRVPPSTPPPAVGRAPTPPSVGRAPTPPSVGQAPTPGSPSIVGNVSAPLGRAQTAPPSGRAQTAPPSGRAQTAPPSGRAQTAPPVVGRAPSQPSVSRTRTPAGGVSRPATPAGGMPRAQTAPPGSRNDAATVPPPMRAQTPPSDRKLTTPPGGLPLPAPPRSERMAAQPDPELESQNVSLPYQSINIAPSTSTPAGPGMPSMPGQTMPMSNQNIATSAHGMANQNIAMSTHGNTPIPNASTPNQSAPMSTHGMANQRLPMPTHGMSNPNTPVSYGGMPAHMPNEHMPTSTHGGTSMQGGGVPHQHMPMPGYGMPTPDAGMPAGASTMQTPYGAQPYPTSAPYAQVVRPATGTPQAMTAASAGGGMKRVLVIAIAAIVVSAVGIAIVMLT